ncbi:hypothetical protein QFZ53_001457 [Microbacterium natoriense]|uniref:LPXTG cell wall anchor domain-containing protein n=1 Tax=Microbacterium natoriense TaxID=284570 RepID=A0AAW8EUT4_9MICO|nr:hypothetical protein [Microbacterium natoriense]
MESPDCLAPTGADPLVPIVIALLLLTVGLTFLCMGRKKRRFGVAVFVALLIGSGTLVMAPATTAHAASDGCAVPSSPPVPVPTPTPTEPVEPAQTPAYDLILGPVSWTEAPPRDGSNFPQLVPGSLANATSDAPTGAVSITIPNEPNGYWVISNIMLADGSVDASAVIVSGPDFTTVTFSSPPTAGSTNFFQIELTYQYDSWSHEYVEQPDGSLNRYERPASEISGTVAADPDNPQGSTSSTDLPPYVGVIAAP